VESSTKGGKDAENSPQRRRFLPLFHRYLDNIGLTQSNGDGFTSVWHVRKKIYHTTPEAMVLVSTARSELVESDINRSWRTVEK
jgi:hypothetical protein